ncbi:MAG: DegV family protein [Anaerolineaceae bacterium]|jgi:DegV family protein with EDD domain|nr:DegV family protein [Anaerolineaceae bacterium]
MVKIVADTTSGILLEEARNLNIGYIPQIINFGEKSYRDDTELNNATFLKMLLASDDLPTTAAPPPALYYPIYQQAQEDNETVIVICPSALVSGTVRSATIAAQDFPEADIRIIDSRSIGGGLASLVLRAHSLAKEGKSANEIESHITSMADREKNYFVVDTLEFLHRGGRIGGAKALFGSVLQIKPILKLENGQAEPVESQRTQRKALNRLIELVTEECPYSAESHLCVMHGDSLEKAQELADLFSRQLNIPTVRIFDLPPAFLTHTGPGILGVSFFTKE